MKLDIALSLLNGFMFGIVNGLIGFTLGQWEWWAVAGMAITAFILGRISERFQDTKL